MEDWELTTATVNQEGLESSLSRCVTQAGYHAISIEKRQKMEGSAEKVSQSVSIHTLSSLNWNGE